ncbi:hypothetical protein OG936_37695 [Streptomyces sp. NBC_00846]|uniref:hypothetical protein n=1 Tax=Streptomyces sp. NBC_00846 TaxID=2975849 RepID=UPI00387043C3|nr:hypothetical protein OG936_37695 [Streptomyces sp. NBC_00846]
MTSPHFVQSFAGEAVGARGSGGRSTPWRCAIRRQRGEHQDGMLFPGVRGSSIPQYLRLRQYVDDVERVRLVYWVTALQTVVVVAFIEV